MWLHRIPSRASESPSETGLTYRRLSRTGAERHGTEEAWTIEWPHRAFPRVVGIPVPLDEPSGVAVVTCLSAATCFCHAN